MKTVLILALTLGTVDLVAQTTTNQSKTLTVSLEGTVTEAATGLPVPNLQINAKGAANPPPVLTDAKGHYIFPGLPPGHWMMYTQRARGYLTTIKRLTLSPGKPGQSIDVVVEKAAVLAGRVIDRDKDPVAGAMVSVRAEGFRNGRPVLESFHSASTNDLGEYRISNLLPGRYYVEVDPKPVTVLKRTKTARSRSQSLRM
ncbi:MAG TPA: carboxypeptidase-like regulatory domain-containing protein [Bryobacteraceae bacterium]|nr:carboxypeptidase-like regulatory domain-containing protein [Bryobacteraceae bacterium]